jgi:hypothetical protein
MSDRRRSKPSSRTERPAVGPLHWNIDDPFCETCYAYLVGDFELDNATIARMKDAGGISLSCLQRARLILAVTGHVAQTRFCKNVKRFRRQEEDKRKKGKDELREGIIKDATSLLERLAAVRRRGWSREIEAELHISAIGGLVGEVLDPHAAARPTSIAEMERTLQRISASKPDAYRAYPEYKPDGRERVDWDFLPGALARIYAGAGGRVSPKSTSRFMRFVGVLRDSLPPEVQGASISRLADRVDELRKRGVLLQSNAQK